MLVSTHMIRVLCVYVFQCYYIGGTPDAATMILNEVTKPMKNFVPPEKICEKLKGKDSQICDLQYGTPELNLLNEFHS